MKDDDLLCKQGDAIYNAIYDAICALSPGEKPEWDMALIGPVTEAVVETMEKQGLAVCYPWQDENEDICYSLPDDRCEHCRRGQEMDMSI